MMRLGDLTQFNRYESVSDDHPIEDGAVSGGVIPFGADHERTVRFTVYTTAKTLLTIWQFNPEDGTIPEGDPLFRLAIDGLETVEFYALGAFALEADGEFWLQCHDGQTRHAVVPDAVTFTRITERRPRNPEVERLEEMLIRNNERRMGLMLDEVRREREAFLRSLDSGARPAGGDQSAPEPSNSTGEPASGASAAGSGAEGAEGDA